MSDEINIYEMKLHQTTYFPDKDMEVTRVPGGWIYTIYSPHSPAFITTVFVPFNNEFQIP